MSHHRRYVTTLLALGLALGACTDTDGGFTGVSLSEDTRGPYYANLSGTWTVAVTLAPPLGGTWTGAPCTVDPFEVRLEFTELTWAGSPSDGYRMTHPAIDIDCREIDPADGAEWAIPGRVHIPARTDAEGGVFDLPHCTITGCDANHDPDPNVSLRILSLTLWGRVRSDRRLEGGILELPSDSIPLGGSWIATR